MPVIQEKCVRTIMFVMTDDVQIHIRYTLILTHLTRPIRGWVLSIIHLYNHHYPPTIYLKVQHVSYMDVPSVEMIQPIG